MFFSRLRTASLFSTRERKCERSERETRGGGGEVCERSKQEKNREAVDIFGKKSTY